MIHNADLQGQGPYSLALKKIENELKEIQKRVNEKMGVRESDTGLASPNLWDIPADKQRLGQHPFQVARCQTIIKSGGLSFYIESNWSLRCGGNAAQGTMR